MRLENILVLELLVNPFKFIAIFIPIFLDKFISSKSEILETSINSLHSLDIFLLSHHFFFRNKKHKLQTFFYYEIQIIEQ